MLINHKFKNFFRTNHHIHRIINIIYKSTTKIKKNRPTAAPPSARARARSCVQKGSAPGRFRLMKEEIRMRVWGAEAVAGDLFVGFAGGGVVDFHTLGFAGD